MAKELSWLYVDLPVWKDEQGRWFIEPGDGIEVEVRPVSAMTLWMLVRTYRSQMPDPPIIEMPLEGVDAVQRMRDPANQEFMRKTSEVAERLDAELTRELLKGIVVPDDDEWAAPWIEEGRPVPPPDSPANRSLRADLMLTVRGVTTYEQRQMVLWAIDAISRETPEAIARAQEFFRNNMGRKKAEAPARVGIEHEDVDRGRSDGDDAPVADDGEGVVQSSPRRKNAKNRARAQQ